MQGRRLSLLSVVLGVLAPSRCWAHGKLTKPVPRDGIATGSAGLDQNNPVSFEPGCQQENTCDAFVCREAAPNPNVAVKVVVAGEELWLEWYFTALHVGDCSVYISYDVDKPRREQKYVKIANLFDCKSYSGKTIKIPSVLPAGKAILRWDWAALHIWPKVEMFVQCVDIDISSKADTSPSDLDSFSITNPPIYPNDGNDGVGYRNAWGGAGEEMTGPSCIDSSINDCHRTAPGTTRNTDSRRSSATVTTPPSTPTPNPTVAEPVEPLPTPPPSQVACVPIGNCGSYAWCNQIKYTEWCGSQGNSCPVPFCKSDTSQQPTPIPAPVPSHSPWPEPPAADHTPNINPNGRTCVPSLEHYYTNPAVWEPFCETQGTANVCSAPMCKWKVAWVQANSKRHNFLGIALVQLGLTFEKRALFSDEL